MTWPCHKLNAFMIWFMEYLIPFYPAPVGGGGRSASGFSIFSGALGGSDLDKNGLTSKSSQKVQFDTYFREVLEKCPKYWILELVG